MSKSRRTGRSKIRPLISVSSTPCFFLSNELAAKGGRLRLVVSGIGRCRKTLGCRLKSITLSENEQLQKASAIFYIIDRKFIILSPRDRLTDWNPVIQVIDAPSPTLSVNANTPRLVSHQTWQFLTMQSSRFDHISIIIISIIIIALNTNRKFANSVQMVVLRPA